MSPQTKAAFKPVDLKQVVPKGCISADYYFYSPQSREENKWNQSFKPHIVQAIMTQTDLKIKFLTISLHFPPFIHFRL